MLSPALNLPAPDLRSPFHSALASVGIAPPGLTRDWAVLTVRMLMMRRHGRARSFEERSQQALSWLSARGEAALRRWSIEAATAAPRRIEGRRNGERGVRTVPNGS